MVEKITTYLSKGVFVLRMLVEGLETVVSWLRQLLQMGEDALAKFGKTLETENKNG